MLLKPTCGSGCVENNQSSQKEIINLIELFIKNLLEENAYGV